MTFPPFDRFGPVQDRAVIAVRIVLAGLILAAGIASISRAMAETHEIGYGTLRYKCLRHIAVDAVKGHDRDGPGDDKSPWASLQAVNDRAGLQAGDCVDVAPGLYPLPTPLSINHGGARNDETGYVVYRSAAPHGAILRAAGAGIYSLIDIKAPFIVIDGFDIDGNKAMIDGPAIDDEHGAGHHVMVENNLIHDAGGSGAQLNDTDFISVRNNVIYGNAGSNQWQMSGISIFDARPASGYGADPADRVPFHIVIAHNISHDNLESFACARYQMKPHCHTDGNGIIIDYSLGQPGSTPYPYGILIQGNLVYHNGGSGIEAGHSNNVTVIQNTAYDDNQDLENPAQWRGELNNNTSRDIVWKDNIAVARPVPGDIRSHNTAVVEGTVPGYPETNVSWINNITFGGTPGDPSVVFDNRSLAGSFAAGNKAGVDPGFAAPANHDFHLGQGSPALGAALPGPETAATNLDGDPIKSKPNIGAY